MKVDSIGQISSIAQKPVKSEPKEAQEVASTEASLVSDEAKAEVGKGTKLETIA